MQIAQHDGRDAQQEFLKELGLGRRVKWNRDRFNITGLDSRQKRYGHGPFTVTHVLVPGDELPSDSCQDYVFVLAHADGTPVNDPLTKKPMQFSKDDFLFED